MAETLHGWIADYNEQGMEGDYWLTFQDEAHTRVDPVYGDQWDRAGLTVLAPGDELTIFAPDGSVRWSGVVGERRSGGLLALLGRERPHWSPPDVPFETWVGWFRTRPPLRATLRRASRP